MKGPKKETLDNLAHEATSLYTDGYKEGWSKAHREGYEQAVNDYAIWKDGVQRIGAMGQTPAQVMEDYDKRMK